MVRVGLQRGLVPDLRLLVVAHLAVGVADVVGDIGMLIVAKCMHRGYAGFVLAVENKLTCLAIVAQEFLLGLLLLLLLNDTVVLLFLFLLVAVVGRGRTVSAHCIDGHRFHADGGHEQRSGGKHTDAAKGMDQGHWRSPEKTRRQNRDKKKRSVIGV